MRMQSRKNRKDMVGLQFASVGEANIGNVFMLFYYVLLLYWGIGVSVRVIRVLGVCIPGFQFHFGSIISLSSPFYYLFLSGVSFHILFGVNVGLWCSRACSSTDIQ